MIKRLQIAGKNGYRRREFQKNAFLYLMALPAVLYLFINNYMPLVGLVVAFKNYTFRGGIFGSQWVGWQTSNTYLAQAPRGLLHEIRSVIIFFLLLLTRLAVLSLQYFLMKLDRGEC